jgi:hypothetical protein
MSEPSYRLRALGALAIGALALGGCGSGGDDSETPDTDPDTWRAEATEACEAGTEEAVALPLPQSRRQVSADAEAMVDILITARDSIASLGAPEELETEVDAYLGELDEDIAMLEQVVSEGPPERGGEEGATLLDESAGEAALALDLQACAAFSNAVARTP